MLLNELLVHKKIILASNSPRRKQFLSDLNIPFEVKPSNVDESYPDSFQKEAITDHIAKMKADFFTELHKNEIIIACDTIVWNDNKALGKPENFEEAFEMLKSLSGKTHLVISSVCLKDAVKTKIFNDTTRVTFSNLNDEEITYYIDNYKPYDKAGAYGIQEWIGLVAIQKIEGSYTNVVGMPMEKLYTNLSDFIQ